MAQNEQQQQTVDGNPPVDDKIDVLPDPTADEAERSRLMLEQAAAAASGVDTAAAADKEKKDGKDGLEYVDDPRNAIYKAAAENRAKPITPEQVEDVDPNSAAARYGADAVTSTPADTQAQQPQNDDDVLNRQIKVKINGVEQVVSVKDAVTNFQKVQAGDVYLRQAKETADQIINSAKAIATPAPGAASTQPDAARNANAASDASTDDDGQAPIPKGTKLSPQKLASVVEAISLGSTEEGVKALTEVLEAVQPQPMDFKTQIRNTLAEEKIENQSLGATEQFVKKYPGVVDDKYLVTITGELMRDEMVKDFVAAGFDAKVINEAAPDRATMKMLHDQARIKNPNFGRPLDAIYSAVEKAPQFMKLAGDAKPALDVQVDRGARKVLVPQQPVHRTPPNMPNGQQQQPESRQATLARGFSQINAGRVHQRGA